MAHLEKKAIAIGLGLAAGLASWLLWRALEVPRASRSVEFVDNAAQQAEVLASMVRGGRSAENLAAGRFRYHLEEAQARALIGGFHPSFDYDEQVYYRPKPGIGGVLRWPEHPLGEFSIRVSSEGLREPGPLPTGEFDLRVLLAGDSHAAGACNLEETFASLLEADLGSRFAGRRIDVINAAVGGYGFYNYLGVLRKFGRMDVDLFCLCVYGGNDFVGVIAPHHFFAGLPLEPGAPQFGRRTAAGQEQHAAAMGQSVRSVMVFSEKPQAIEPTLDAAADLTAQMQAMCDDLGVAMLCVYLPSLVEVEWEQDAARLAKLFEVVGLGRDQVAVLEHMGDGYLERVRALEIPVLDLREVFRDALGPFYWRMDHHINLAGHRAIAAALADVVPALAASSHDE